MDFEEFKDELIIQAKKIDVILDEEWSLWGGRKCIVNHKKYQTHQR